MKASGLTTWGSFLIGLRGMCGGLLLSGALRSDTFSVPEHWLTLGAAAVLLASGLITPILRALGWRRLAERVGDAETIPRSGEVECALRSALGDGFSLQEAVRFLHLNRGWDVMLLSPAVATVANLPTKDAIRLVMSAAIATDSGARSPAFATPRES